MVRFSNLKYLKILLRYTNRAINPANVQLPWQVTKHFIIIEKIDNVKKKV